MYMQTNYHPERIGDMNGIKLLCPEPIARVIFCFLLVVNIFWKIVLPNYKVSFDEKIRMITDYYIGE